MQGLPFYEIQDGIYEIDEYDCSNVFVIVGDTKALVLDTGCGIGDIRQTIDRITAKPYEVVLTHGHSDHIGGADVFDAVWLHPDDWYMLDASQCEKAPTLAYRKNYVEIIRKREGKFYDYDPERDLHEWTKAPELLPLADGQTFELGGRTVTAYHCPGHTPGEMVFIDDKTRTLFLGDACNCNLLVNPEWKETPAASVRATLEAMERIIGLNDQYDQAYNSHHDYRGCGCVLPQFVVEDSAQCMKEILDGTATYEEVVNPLSKDGGKKTIAVHGHSMVSFLKGNIREEV